MELVDDDHVVEIRPDARKIHPAQGLYRCEYVLSDGRACALHHELTKGTVVEYVAEDAQALLQNLLPVGYEEKSPNSALLRQAPVIECRNYGLPGAGRRDEQVAPPAMA